MLIKIIRTLITKKRKINIVLYSKRSNQMKEYLISLINLRVVSFILYNLSKNIVYIVSDMNS